MPMITTMLTFLTIKKNRARLTPLLRVTQPGPLLIPVLFIHVSPPLRVLIKSMVLAVLKQTPTTAAHKSSTSPLAHKKGSNITRQLDCTQLKR